MFHPRRLGILLVALLSLLPTPSAAPSAPCALPVDDPVIGRACPTEGGYLVQVIDGSWQFTHGGDPIPATPHVVAPITDVLTACVGPDEPHIRVLYALPSNAVAATVATADARENLIIAGVLHANAIVNANAQALGTEMRWKTRCDENGLPLVERLTLTLTQESFTFYAMADELTARGYQSANAKLLVFYDGRWNGCTCGGWSYIPGGDSPSEYNPNNFGWWAISAVFMGNYGASNGWMTDEVILHEETHGMGGVQPSAPHSSGGWHCNDGWDIMCYADGAKNSSYGTSCFPVGQSSVGALQPYDCNHDDYFHPSPPPGSYLATHWNVGGAQNRFMARG